MARAQLTDEREEEIKNNEEVESLDTEDTTVEQEVTQEQPQTDEDEIPEKYRGKSMKDLVEMHRNAEQALGKQSSEVGELRKVVDDFISAQLSQQKAPQKQQQEEDEYDFFIDPDKAVYKAIENHPKIKEAEQYTLAQKKQLALSTLQSKHPDMESILKNEKFAEWIKGSKIRTQLFVQADQQFDYEAADELFSLWKERQSVVQQTAQVEQQARKQQLKAANTGNARGTTEGSRKKVYRRADIIKLMRDDPERYQALANEIMQAYQEGRVK
jgi:hypothetical protein